MQKIAQKGRRSHIVRSNADRADADSLRYEEKLMALHQHALQLVTAESLDEIVTQTLDAMEFGLDFDYANVNIVEGNWLRCKETRGFIDFAKPDLPIDGSGVMAKAVSGATTIRVLDTRNEENYLAPQGNSHGENFAMFSELAVPVIIDKRPVAVLNVESKRLNAFTDEDERLLETLANHVASGLKHIEQTTKAKRLVDALHKSEERYQCSFKHLPARGPFLKIIENALDTMPSGGEIIISVKESHGNFEITFTGIAMTLEDLENIQKALRTASAQEIRLVTCGKAVEAQVSSVPVERTFGGRRDAFTITLPARTEIEGPRNA